MRFFDFVPQNIEVNRLFRFVLVLGLVCTICEARSKYCDLCDNHIACSNSGNFSNNCSLDRALLKITSAEKEYILKLHNRMRNKIALGQIPGYTSAAKMPTLKWDNELAYLAELNARSCEYGHDACRATTKFRWAGQNIARRGNTKGYEKLSDSIKYMITDWFTEYKDANMEYIDLYHNHKFGKKIGHFTVMVNDHNDALGCASGRYMKKVIPHQNVNEKTMCTKDFVQANKKCHMFHRKDEHIPPCRRKCGVSGEQQPFPNKEAQKCRKYSKS